jgi:hypothetical protein
LKLQKRYDVQVDELLRDAMKAAEEELAYLDHSTISAVVRSAHIMQAVTSISAALSQLWMSMGDLVRAGQEEARTEALKMSFDWDKTLLYLAIPPGARAALKQSLIEGGRFNVEAALARVYKTRLPLSAQVYKTAELTSGWVEHRVNLAISRGATPAQLAREVRAFINPNVRGGAAYAAKRLARTEIVSAYHAVIVVHNEDKPWVTSIKWNLSGSHPSVDICDELARRNGGIFPKNKVPAKPHPQCLCYIVPVVVSEEDFLKRFRAGNFRKYMAATYGA